MRFTRREFLGSSFAAFMLNDLEFFNKSFQNLNTTKIIVLGIMQDAGLPQLGDNCERCTLARNDRAEKRFVACLGLITPSGKTYLFDTTPDVREQIDLLNSKVQRSNTNSRQPVDGVFLTHGHMGHYTGLMQFGFESLSADKIPVYCTSKMKSYLTNNGPWGQLVTKDNIILKEIRPDTNVKSIELEEGISVDTFWVPHRQEYTDTVGFIIKGPEKSLLYLPDIDSWSAWGIETEITLSKVDYALVDGSFYSNFEIPGRDMSNFPHPKITDSIDRFKDVPALDNTKIYFTHFNHSNPVLNKDDEIRSLVEQEGFHYVTQGMEFEL